MGWVIGWPQHIRRHGGSIRATPTCKAGGARMGSRSSCRTASRPALRWCQQLPAAVPPTHQPHQHLALHETLPGICSPLLAPHVDTVLCNVHQGLAGHGRPGGYPCGMAGAAR